MAEIASATTPDGRFTYLAAGDPAAPTIVFLHGIGGGARLFTRQLAALGDRFRTIAWNMPGYAGSAAIPPGGIDGYGEALARFVAALGLPDPILVGHSIGGMIVQAYLAAGMGPARAAVLAQTSAAFGGKDPRWAEDFVRARLAPLDEGRTLRDLAPGMVAGMVGEGADEAGPALAREAIADTPDEAFRASTLAMIGFDLRDALGRICVPTLLVAGTEDANAPVPGMSRMAERIAGARLDVLEGCGHLVMLERPEAFTA
ncbi:MAG: alpha/beta fold hydrolase, partial [Methylobacteriaceae bacterium]|nr:alpha/beta fold hydrolase [Methylobacteriaceae bacterium]